MIHYSLDSTVKRVDKIDTLRGRGVETSSQTTPWSVERVGAVNV